MGRLLESVLVFWISETQQKNWSCHTCSWTNGGCNSSPFYWNFKQLIHSSISFCCSSFFTCIFFPVRAFLWHTFTYQVTLSCISLCQCLLPRWYSLHFYHWTLCLWNSISFTACMLNIHHWAVNCFFHATSWICTADNTFITRSAFCSAFGFISSSNSKKYWAKSKVSIIPVWFPALPVVPRKSRRVHYIASLNNSEFWHIFTFPC